MQNKLKTKKSIQDKTKKFRFLGLAGIALCALCYLLPVAGAIFGVGALASLATHLEKLPILFLALNAIGSGIYMFWKSRRSKACATNCACKSATEKRYNSSNDTRTII